MSAPAKNPSAAGPQAPEYDLLIEAGRANIHYWGDLWHYRDLLGFLTIRDSKVRYKQTVLGRTPT
jgi:lipopolysaccharide transport system permease protein